MLSRGDKPVETRQVRKLWTSSAAVPACLTTWAVAAALPAHLRGELSTLLLTAEVLVACVLASQRAAGARGLERRGWAAVAVATGLWALGEAFWTWGSWAGPDLTRRPDGYLFAISSLVLAAGVTLFFLGRASSADRRVFAFDALVLALGAFAVFWQFAVEPLGTLSPARGAANVGYDLASTAAFAVAVVVLIGCTRYRGTGTGRSSLALLAAAAVAAQAGVGAYIFLVARGSYHAGGLTDIGFALQAGFIITAALLSPAGSAVEPAPATGLSRNLTSITPVSAGALVLVAAITAPSGHSRPGVVPVMLLTAILALLGARQVLARRAISAPAPGAEVVAPSLRPDPGGAGVMLTARPAPEAIEPGPAEPGPAELAPPEPEPAEAGPGPAERGPAEAGPGPAERGPAEAELAPVPAEPVLYDPVTGLPNAALLADRVAHALSTRVRDGGTSAVMFCELDGVGAVNDKFGRDAADHVLRTVAERFAQAVRPGDTVARVDGDCLAIVVSPLVSAYETAYVAARLLGALDEPIAVGPTLAQVRASIGVAATESGQEDADSLVRGAEIAMRQARAEGGGLWCRFDPTVLGDPEDRSDVEQTLRTALDNAEFVLHYQPVADLVQGTMTSVEALVRWEHDGSLVLPAGFIALAEETGLIVELGAWALAEACRHGAEWQEHGPVAVSVNLSGCQLEPALVQTVRDALAASGLPPERLVLELTEGALVGRAGANLEVVGALQALGVSIAIDDFGSGSSSPTPLSKLPVDLLKLDRSFVTHLASPEGVKALAAILDLARALGLGTVAKGVEDAQQLAVLRDLGVSYAQGFWFSRPVPPGAITEALAATASVAGTATPGASADDTAAAEPPARHRQLVL